MSGQPFPPGGRDEVIPNTPYKFTPDEMRVLAKCNKESFYQRSLPLSTLFGLGTYWGVKSGYFKPHPSWGAAWKVTGAVFLGYFIGKISYQQRCAEYFMALPNSEVGEQLRRRRQNRMGGSSDGSSSTEIFTDSFSSSAIPSFGVLPSVDVYSDMSDSRSYIELDTDRPLNDGLNDAYRPSIDYPALEEDPILPPPQGGTVSYEDLRRKNREEYIYKNTKMYRNVPSPEEVPSTVGSNPDLYRITTDQPQLQDRPEPPPPKPPTYTQKNKYGDVWEK